MKLGTLFLENNLILAPMLQVSTAPFRRFCRKFSHIGLVCVPMLYTKRIETHSRSILRYLHKIEEERPVSVQLIGSDLDALKSSIDFLESYQFDVLDINAGCPSRRAIKAEEGGYLLKNLDVLETLLKASVKYSSRPVSLKMRTGFNNTNNIEKIADIVNRSGIDFLTIHGRTVKERYYDSTLDLNTIKKIKSLVKIPVVGNGNIYGGLTAVKFLEFTKVDAVMIGRASMGNPEIFQQINQYFSKGIEPKQENSFSKVRKYLKMYEECIDEFLDDTIDMPFSHEKFKLMELRRNAIWFTKNIEASTSIRTQFSKTKNLEELRNLIAFN
ncbi:MAG: tRNA-dihydrouridine synthase family protein [Candidatus Lokiarchaeota archaeon]|nr:tRNA-dihydrouridine synthase family protein [Candidatus Lokiarchaeota archaeon]